MPNIFTDRDLRNEVLVTLDHPEDFKVDAIVEEIQRDHGTVSIEEIPDRTYWAIVERHARESIGGL